MAKVMRGVMAMAGVAAGIFVVSSAQADIKEMKPYLKAFPGAKITCVDCHTEAAPQQHGRKYELNDYGKAVVAEAKKQGVHGKAKVTEAVYRKVGRIEDFKAVK